MCSNGVPQTAQRDGGAAAEATSSGAAAVVDFNRRRFINSFRGRKNNSPAYFQRDAPELNDRANLLWLIIKQKMRY